MFRYFIWFVSVKFCDNRQQILMEFQMVSVYGVFVLATLFTSLTKSLSSLSPSLSLRSLSE